MNCLKCGREIDEGHFFCEDCLIGMAKYPVKPGTAVLLPARDGSSAPKKNHYHRRSKVPPEEQLKSLKKRVRILSFFLALCIVLLLALAIPAVRYFKEDHFLPGQNYSAVTATTASEGE